MQKISPASIISRIFDPLVIFSLLGINAAWRSLPPSRLPEFATVFFIGVILPPLLLLLWAVKTKKVSSWDLSNRRQRVKVFTVFLGFIIFDLVLAKVFGNTVIFQLFILFTLWFLGLFVITLFWKISGHTAAVTLATLFIIDWYGSCWWPIFGVVPLVGWARIITNNHSLAQVIIGVIYSALFFLIV